MDDKPFQFRLKSLLVVLALVSVGLSIVYAVFIGPQRAADALNARTRQLNGQMYVTNRFSIVSFKNQPVTDSDLAPVSYTHLTLPTILRV